METHRLALNPGFRLDNFQIERILGKGGFGITYVALDLSLGKRVAIKELLPDSIATRVEGITVVPQTASMQESWEWARARFLEEAQILANFSHPAIVGVHRLIEANGTVYIVMDFVDGESYEARLRRIGRETDEETLLEVITPILDGLQQVHSKNLLHRDIKPENILLSSSGQPVLIDFGSARTSIGATMSMTSIVTHGYSPIEQYQTKGRMGPWTDIYAMGAVMCRAITGEKPPVAADRLMADDFEWLSYRSVEGFSPAFLRTVDWALRLKPEERPPSILEWREQWNAKDSEIPRTSNSFSSLPAASELSLLLPIPEVKTVKTEPLSIWSLVLGILSIVGCSVGGVLLAIPAVLCGHFGIAAIKKHTPRNGYGLAVAGLVLGYAAIGITLISVPFFLPAINGATERAKKAKELQEQNQTKAKSDYVKAVSDLEKDVKKIFEEPHGTNALPKNTPVVFNDKPEGDSQENQLVALVRSFNNDLLSFQKDYESALDKAGINELLDPDRIESDQGFSESRRILTKMREAVHLYRAKSMNLFSDFPKKLDNYSFSDSVKKSFLEGYREGIAKSGPLIKETWDLELVVCNNFNDLLNHLNSSQSRWKAKGGQFLFETDADLKKFNSILSQINSCVERQKEIKKQSQDSTMQNFKDLKTKSQQ